MRTLQFCILFPLPLSPMTLEFPLYRGRAYLLVRLFLALRALPWRIHIRFMILPQLLFCFTFHSAFVCSFIVVTTPILSSFRFLSVAVSGLVVCLLALRHLLFFSLIPFQSLTVSCLTLPPFTLGVRRSSASPLAMHTLS